MKTPFEIARDATKNLHEGMATNTEDESLDKFRDEVADIWRRLSEIERTRINGLSADLYMLSRNEDFAPSLASLPRREIVTRMFSALDGTNADEALELLRAAGLECTPELRAYLRAKCWGMLGDRTIERWFLDFAHQRRVQTDLDRELTAMRLPSRSRLREAQQFGRLPARSSHGVSSL